MFKKIIVTVAAASLLLGNIQAKSLHDVLGVSLYQMNSGVTKLDLGSKGITKIKQEEGRLLAKNYPNLTELYLSRNKLQTLPAGVFSGMTRLERLWLTHNQLKTLVGVFDGLTNLTMLDIAHNQLRNLPVGVFKGLTRLEQLSLSHNQLKTLPVGIFDGLTNLELIWLDGNGLGFRSRLRLRKKFGLKVKLGIFL